MPPSPIFSRTRKCESFFKRVALPRARSGDRAPEVRKLGLAAPASFRSLGSQSLESGKEARPSFLQQGCLASALQPDGLDRPSEPGRPLVGNAEGPLEGDPHPAERALVEQPADERDPVGDAAGRRELRQG